MNRKSGTKTARLLRSVFFVCLVAVEYRSGLWIAVVVERSSRTDVSKSWRVGGLFICGPHRSIWCKNDRVDVYISSFSSIQLPPPTGISRLSVAARGYLQPGQTSALPPSPIRSVLQSGYFSGFWTSGVNEPLGILPSHFPTTFSPFP